MASVEDRIIRLKWDASQFTKAVQNTLTLLNKVKTTTESMASSVLNSTTKMTKGLTDVAKNVSKISGDIKDNASKLKDGFSSVEKSISKIGDGVKDSTGKLTGVFKDAKDGITDLQNKFDSFKTEDFQKAIENVNSHFTLMGRIGEEAIGKIASAVTNIGAQIAGKINELVFAPISTGFDEYGLLMDSTQVILANSGESLERVDETLEKLNHYADKTIYNFANMTNAIGRFTASGVGLDESVDAIEGLSNLSALVGVSAEQNTGAMEALSKALSVGYMNARQWASFEVTGGLAGKVFRDELIKTADALGYFNKEWTTTGGTKPLSGSDLMARAQQDFRNTLSYGWVDKEVLLQTLAKFTDETTELGQKAMKAATEVRTFSKLWDALTEAVQSSWSETYKYIFGNYEEGTNFWTAINDEVSKFVGLIGDSRNGMLKFWHDNGGREATIEGLAKVWSLLKESITPVADAIKEVFPWFKLEGYEKGGRLVELSQNFRNFADSLSIGESPARIMYERVVELGQGIKSLFKVVGSFNRNGGLNSLFEGFMNRANYYANIVSSIYYGIRHTLTDETDKLGAKLAEFAKVFERYTKLISTDVWVGNYSDIADARARKMAGIIYGLTSPIKNLIKLVESIDTESIFGILISKFDIMLRWLDSLSVAVEKAFDKTNVSWFNDFLYKIERSVKQIKDYLYTDDAFNKLTNMWTGLLSIIKLVANVVSQIASFFYGNFIEGKEASILDKLLTIASATGTWVTNLTQAVEKYNVISNALSVVKSFIDPIVKAIGTIFSDIVGIIEGLTGIDLPFNDRGWLNNLETSAQDSSDAISTAFSDFNDNLYEISSKANEYGTIIANVMERVSGSIKTVYDASVAFLGPVVSYITDTVAGAVASLKDMYDTFAGNKATAIVIEQEGEVPFIMERPDTLAEKLDKLIKDHNALNAAAAEAGETVAGWLESAITLADDLVDRLLGSAVGENWIGKLITPLGLFYNQLKKIMSLNVVPMLQNIADIIGTLASTFAQAIQDVFSYKSKTDAITTIFDALAKAVQWLHDVITSDWGVSVLTRTFSGILSVFRLVVDVVAQVVTGIRGAYNIINSNGAITNIVERISNVFGGLSRYAGDFVRWIERAVRHNSLIEKFFETLGSLVAPLADAFDALLTVIETFLSALTGLDFTNLEILKSPQRIFGPAKKVVTDFADSIVEKFDWVSEKIGGTSGIISKTLGSIGDVLYKVFFDTEDDAENSSGFFGSLLTSVKSIGEKIRTEISSWFSSDTDEQENEQTTFFDWIGSKLAALKEKIDSVKEAFRSIFKPSDEEDTLVEESLGEDDKISFLDSLADKFLAIKEFLSKVGEQIVNGVMFVYNKVSEIVGGFNLDNFFNLMGGLFTAGSLYNVFTFFNNVREALSNGSDFIESLTKIGDSITDTFGAIQNTLNAKALFKIALAIGVLTAACYVLASIDEEKLSSALWSIAIMFGEIIGAFKLFTIGTGNLKSLKLSSLASTLIKISASVLILAIALKKIADLDGEQLAKGLIGIGVLLAEIIATSKLFNSDNGFSKSSVGLVIFAAAIALLVIPIKQLSKLSIEELIKGLVGLGAVLLEMSLFLNSLKTNKMGVNKALGLVIFAASLEILVDVVNKISGIDTKSLVKGLVGLGAILLEISLFMNMTKKINVGLFKGLGLVLFAASLKIFASVVKQFGDMDTMSLVKGLLALGAALAAITISLKAMPLSTPLLAVGILVFANAMLVLIGAIALAGQMNLKTILKGFLAIAGILTILGVAGALLAPIIPAILGLSVALGIFGAAVLLTGVGVTALSVGLTALGMAFTVGGAGIVAGIGLIVSTLLEMIPVVVAHFVDGLTLLIVTLGDSMPQILDAFGNILTAVVDFITEKIPYIVSAVLTMISEILKAVNENVEPIITTASEIITKMMNAFGEQTPAIIDSFVGMVIDIINGVAEAIRGNAEPLFDALRNLVSSVIELVLTALQKIVECIPGVGDDLSAFLEKAKTNVRSTLAPKSFEEMGSGAGNALGSGFSDTIGEIPFVEESEGIMQDILSGLGNDPDAFDSLGADLIGKLVDGLLSIDLLQIGKDLGGKLLEGLSSIGDAVFDFGASAVGGIVEGAKTAGNAVLDAGSWVGEKVSNGFSSLLGIESPSKEFYEYGGYISEGLTNGLYASQGVVDDATGNLAAPLLDVLSNGAPDELFAEATRIGKQIVNSMKDGIEGDGNPYTTVAASLNLQLNDAITKARQTLKIDESTNSSSVFKDMAVTCINSITSVIGDKKTEILDTVEGVSEETVKHASTTLSSTMKNVKEGILNEIGQHVSDAIDVMKSTAISCLDGIKSDVGAQAFGTFDYVGSEAENGLAGRENNFFNIGANLMVGFINGVNSRAQQAYDAIMNIGNITTAIFANRLGVHSPSTVAYSDGEYFILGFINAVKAGGSKIDATMKSVFAKPLNTVEALLNEDFEYTPKIRPVVDLDDIDRSTKAIDGVFASRSLAFTEDALKLSEANRKNRALEAKRRTYNDKNVVSAINGLRGDINGLNTAMSNYGLYLDGDTLVGRLTDKIDRNLATNQIRRKRGI